MKRRAFKSILHVPYGCGWTAICEENKAWHLPNGAAEWVELPELPPVDDTDATIAEIHNRLNKGCFTREEFAKEHDRLYGTDMANLLAGFFDPSLGQPWPEDQASDRPAARPRRIIYQHVVGQNIAGGGGVSSEPIAYQCIAGENGGLGIQDLPIRDWANLAGKIDRAERLLNMSCWKRAATNPCPDVTDIIDISFALRSLVNDIRSEFSQ
jgi:hypothetical protein